MAGDKYNIDDILKEVSTRRTKDSDADEDFSPKTARSKSARDNKNIGSVTEILNSEEIRTASQKKKNTETGRQHSKLSVTQILNSNDLKKEHSARQMTEQESEDRLANDISRAMENKKRSRYNIEDNTLDIAKSDDDSDDYIKLFVSQQNSAQEQPSDDGIVFHSPEDFVPTDTMQLRKQKKIADINEALLRIDSEADSPDDMLDSINPMESRQKAVEIIKNGENTNEFQFGKTNTDTFTVSPFRLKKLAHGEHIREFPADSGDGVKEKSVEFKGIQNSAVSAEIHLGDSILDALNKKIAENENSADQKIEQDAAENTRQDADEVTAAGSEVDDVRRVDELAQKKKLKIANFILENHDTEELEPMPDDQYDDYDEDEDEPIDLDDENVIRDRLNRAAKGLTSRLLILVGLFCVTLFIAIVNAVGADLKLGFLTNIISRRVATDNYLYTHLVIGILSFTACSSVVSNGLARLFKLRPDGDTLCAFSHIAAIAAIIPNIFGGNYIDLGRSEIYLLISLGSLLFNTLSKLLTVSTAKRNFDFIFNKNEPVRYSIDRCNKESEAHLAKGVVSGIPVIGAMRKTEMLYDFIISTYCEDASDRMSRKIVPGVIAAAFVGGIAAFLTHTTNDQGAAVTLFNRISWGMTVLSAIFAIGAPFSSSMTVTLPMYLAARKNNKRGSAILGYNAAAGLSDFNGVLVEARTLFPADSVRITNICGYDKPKSRGEVKVSIDEAIIYAASLAVASDSIMSDAFFGMLNRKRELLKEVSGCVYENNLGVMGWIERQRVLLGNRQHMKSHEITVPNLKKETAANVNNDEVLYLAVGGEVCLIFFVKLNTNPAIRQRVQELCDSGVSLIIKTVDGLVTDLEISEQFDIEANKVKILPFEAHETFVDCTRFVPRAKAAVSCNGTFTSFADSVIASNTLRSKAFISNIVQLCGVVLGILLAFIFGLFANFSMFNLMIILVFNIVFGIAALGAQFFRRL